jgi:hypothetical protein
VNHQVETNVNFYGSLKDFAFAEPYAVLSNSEVASILKRFDRWVSLIAAHPDLMNGSGHSVTTQIKMVTALRLAVKNSMQAGIFPNVILSPSEYQATIDFLAETRGNRVVP